MSDDMIRSALAGVREAVDPLVRPPGIEATLRTVRRRRTRRATVAAVALGLVAALGAFVASERSTPGPLTPTPWPTPSASAMPSTVATASPTVSPSPPRGAEVAAPACYNQIVPKVTNASLSNGNQVRFYLWKPAGTELCPGLAVHAEWRSFSFVNYGEQFAGAGSGFSLTSGQPSHTETITYFDPCPGDVYYYIGLPKSEWWTIPAGQHWSITWSSGRKAGIFARKIVTNTCPTPIG